jgi:acetoin utilization protein AcuB
MVEAMSRVMLMPAIERFMTSQPWTIRSRAHIAVAREMMREHCIRHLPVLEGGKLVGIVSERDLLVLEKLLRHSSADATVEEAMVDDVYVATEATPADEVLDQMAQRKIGSCVVIDKHEHVTGVFTTVDAMKFFADVLRTATS